MSWSRQPKLSVSRCRCRTLKVDPASDDSPIVTLATAGRSVLVVMLARWTWLFTTAPLRQDVVGASFLHTISIPFHEAGHILFSPFGDLLTASGGSLLQVLIPAACAAAFLTTSPNPFGAAVATWWTGQNLADVAMYIDDARALQLVLIGGRTGAEVEGHDWEHILTSAGWLHRDHQIAGAVQAAAALLMIGALVWAVTVTVRERSATPPDR
jgi:hypothetical protein